MYSALVQYTGGVYRVRYWYTTVLWFNLIDQSESVLVHYTSVVRMSFLLMLAASASFMSPFGKAVQVEHIRLTLG